MRAAARLLHTTAVRRTQAWQKRVKMRAGAFFLLLLALAHRCARRCTVIAAPAFLHMIRRILLDGQHLVLALLRVPEGQLGRPVLLFQLDRAQPDHVRRAHAGRRSVQAVFEQLRSVRRCAQLLQLQSVTEWSKMGANAEELSVV